MSAEEPRATRRRGRRRARRAPAARADRKGPRGLRGRRLRLAAAIALAGVSLSGALFAAYAYLADRQAPGAGRRIAVSWPGGLDAGQAAALLRELGVTDDELRVRWVFRLRRSPRCFVPGPHLLTAGASARALAAMLCRSEARPVAKLVVPEGFHRWAIAERLEEQGVAARSAFLEASADPAFLAEMGVPTASRPEGPSAEGYLFPATYELRVDSDARDVVRRMVAESDRRWERVARRHAARARALAASLGFARREIVTLASLVEREAAAADERPLVASVFLNRLQDAAFRPRLLQSDPTSAYACIALPQRVPACAGFSGKPTPELHRDPKNPYSTYTAEGLPPGPIANPGEASLEAVLAAPETRYYYFVARGGGRHVFSESYEAHTEAVRRLRDQE